MSIFKKDNMLKEVLKGEELFEAVETHYGLVRFYGDAKSGDTIISFEKSESGQQDGDFFVGEVRIPATLRAQRVHGLVIHVIRFLSHRSGTEFQQIVIDWLNSLFSQSDLAIEVEEDLKTELELLSIPVEIVDLGGEA